VLYRYSEVIRAGMAVADLLLVAGAWLAAYALRFHAPGMPEPPGSEIPAFRQYALALPVILPVWFLLFRSRGLYRPQRVGSLADEAGRVLLATAFGVLVLVTIGFFARSYYYSRLVTLLFAGLSSGAVLGFRAVLRLSLRRIRRRGYNLRFVVVVGAGELAELVIERLQAHPEAGLRVVGVVSDETARRALRGVPIVSPFGELQPYLAAQRRSDRRIDQVVIALSREESHQLEKVLSALDEEIASV